MPNTDPPLDDPWRLRGVTAAAAESAERPAHRRRDPRPRRGAAHGLRGAGGRGRGGGERRRRVDRQRGGHPPRADLPPARWACPLSSMPRNRASPPAAVMRVGRHRHPAGPRRLAGERRGDDRGARPHPGRRDRGLGPLHPPVHGGGVGRHPAGARRRGARDMRRDAAPPGPDRCVGRGRPPLRVGGADDDHRWSSIRRPPTTGTVGSTPRCPPPATPSPSWPASLDGSIDAIATDHAPHPPSASRCHSTRPRPGSSASRRPWASACWRSAAGRLTLLSLLSALSLRPAALIGESRSLAGGATANLVVFDPAASWRVEPDALASQSVNTPLLGMELPGVVRLTVAGGRVTYDDGLVGGPDAVRVEAR